MTSEADVATEAAAAPAIHSPTIHAACGRPMYFCRCPSSQVSPEDRAAYWRDRWADQGIETVLHAGDSPEMHAKQTAIDVDILRRILRDYAPDAKFIFEFGCGWGRLLRPLVQADYEAWGVEPSERGRAEAAKLFPRLTIDPDASSVPDGYADVGFTWTVLQHLDYLTHREAARQLERIVRPGGLVVLFENTTPGKSPIAWTIFRPADHYVELMSECELIHSETLIDGQQHSLMVFRRKV